MTKAKTISQNDLKDMYTELGVDLKALGCIMLEVNHLKVSDIVPEEELYFSDNMQYAQGIVSEWSLAHVTLLYGLMQSGKDLKQYVDLLLDGINLSKVTISHIETFDNVDNDTEYSVYVARVEVTPELAEANGNLRKLPHIDGFAEYKPHITLFYAKRNEDIKAQLLGELNGRFAGKKVSTKEINYGD